jgi:hypothetical protein
MQPSPTPDGSTRIPNVFGWTSGQIVLLAGVADDVRPTCRLADVLPEGSDEGIRCFPDGVKAVGFYLVANTDWMQDMLYNKRLASYGVTRKSVGTCVDGVPGDILDSVTDGEEARTAATSMRTVSPTPGSPCRPATVALCRASTSASWEPPVTSQRCSRCSRVARGPATMAAGSVPLRGASSSRVKPPEGSSRSPRPDVGTATTMF